MNNDTLKEGKMRKAREVYVNMKISKNEVTPWEKTPTGYTSYPVCHSTEVGAFSKNEVLFREVIEPSSELGDVDALNRKIKTVLNYIKTSEGNLTQYMWAATIIAVLLECDFRDSKQKLDEWYEETK